jgi:uncharacterized membrane protein (UPF0127 family)
MKIVLATSLKARIVGLLSSKVCRNGEILMLAPCNSIHSLGMRSQLDIAFIDKYANVLASERQLPAGKLRSSAKAVAVLERRSNITEPWLKPGDKLDLIPGRLVRR